MSDEPEAQDALQIHEQIWKREGGYSWMMVVTGEAIITLRYDGSIVVGDKWKNNAEGAAAEIVKRLEEWAPWKDRIAALEAELAREKQRASDLAETAWGLIANASGGDWSRETAAWRQAAERWRAEYHAVIDKKMLEAKTNG